MQVIMIICKRNRYDTAQSVWVMAVSFFIAIENNSRYNKEVVENVYQQNKRGGSIWPKKILNR